MRTRTITQAVMAGTVTFAVLTSCAGNTLEIPEPVIPYKNLEFTVGFEGGWTAEAESPTKSSGTEGKDSSAVVAPQRDTLEHMEFATLMDNAPTAYLDCWTEDMGYEEFAIASEEEPATKASLVTSLSSFNFFGYAYSGTWTTSLTPYIHNESASGSSTFTSENTHQNPASSTCKTRYYAYTPATGLAASSSGTTPVTLSYTVPTDNSSQKDVLVGVSGDYTSSSATHSITFSHALSAIWFQTGSGSVPCTIKSVTLKNVYGNNTYTLGSGWGTPGSTKSSFALTGLSKSVTETSGTAVTNASQYFLMIPQTVPSGATLEVVVNDGSDHTLSVSIAGHSWQAGKKHVYSLSFPSLEQLVISPTSATIAYNGTKAFSVTPVPSSKTDWTYTISGTGLSATKNSGTQITVSNNNTSGTDETSGLLTLTSSSGRCTATAAINATSLQESIAITPTSATIANGSSGTFTVSGTYPEGYTVSSSDSELSVSKSGNTVTATNNSTSTSGKSATITVTTGVQGKTATATVTMSRAAASFTGVSPTSLTWEYNNTNSKTVTISGSHIALGDISLGSLSHFTATKTSTTTITVTPKGTNTGDTPYNETLAITIGGVTKNVSLSQNGAKEIVSTEVVYNAPTFTLTAPANVPASGGTSAAPSVTGIAQTQYIHYTYKDGSTSDGAATAVSPLSSTTEYSKDGSSYSTTHTGYYHDSLHKTIQGETTLGTIYVRVTANGKSTVKSVTIKQDANSVSYGTPSITFTYPSGNISAAGGSKSATISATQSVTYSSGDSETYSTLDSKSFSGSATGFTLDTTNGKVTAESNSGTSRSITVTASVTMNTKGNTATATVTQDGDGISYYDAPTGLSISAGDIPASGGSVSTATISGTISQVVHYTSGATSTIYPEYTKSWSTAVSGGDLGTTPTARTKKGTLTLTYTANGKSGSASCDVYQAQNKIESTTKTISAISASPTSVGAGGGTSTISGGTGTITDTYTSGKSKDTSFTSTKTVTSPATISGSTVTIPANEGSSRTFTVTYSYDGAASKTCTISQSGDSVVNSNYNDHIIAYGTPTITIGSGMTAAGGNATVTASVSNTWQSQTLYASGKTVNNTSRPVAGTVSLSIVTNGNNRFSLSGTTLSHSSMGKNATTDNVTVRATNAGDSSKYKDASASITNSLGSTEVNVSITAYGTPTITIGSGMTAAGGSATVTASVSNTQTYYYQYTSGSYDGGHTRQVAGTVNLSIVTNGNSRFSLSGTTLSHSSMGKNATTDNVTVRATNAGDSSKYKDASASITNSLGSTEVNVSITAYGTPTYTTSGSITAAGGSVTITGSVTNTQTYYYQYTSGSYDGGHTRQVAGTVGYSLVTNGNNRFSLSSNVLSHSNMTTNEATDSWNVKIYNASSTGKYASYTGSVTNSKSLTSAEVTTTTGFSVTANRYTSASSPCPATGGTATISGTRTYTRTTAKYTYTSGSTTGGVTTTGLTQSVTPTITSAGKNSSNNSFTGSYSGTTVTIPSLGNTQFVAAGTYTVSAQYDGKSATCLIYQAAQKNGSGISQNDWGSGSTFGDE